MKNLFLLTILLSVALTGCSDDKEKQPQAVPETEGTLSIAEVVESDHYDELANLPFPGNQPTQETADVLHNELIFQRGVQSYLWALPAMNMYGMREGQRKAFGDDSNVLIITKNRPDSKMLFSTANPDVIYAFAWLDLKKEGPMVLDMPPGLQGLLDDMWHRPITDIGAAGPDRNKGGKYLILPPGYTGEVPEGYFTAESSTYGVFIFLRAFLADGETDQGVALLEKSRIYPLSKSENPPAMEFPNASGVAINGDFPRGFEYFERLADFINYETISREDFSMRGLIAGLGIVKGQPFSPDAKTKTLLDKAGQVGFKMAATLSYDFRPAPKIYENRNWEQMFIGGSPVFEKDTYHNQDASVSFFHKAYSTSKAMVIAMPGKGSQYLLGSRDSDGDLLTGKNTYRIHMPANVPAANYWSIVLYDADTRVLMDNGQSFPSVASNQKVTYNEDGSADIYLGPNEPADKNANWIKTIPGRGYFSGIRLYSPTNAFFEQTWRPDNIVKTNMSGDKK
ncbi:MAG: DUF1254 domain-containing protein [Oceanicoccus sp.]